MFRKSDLRRIQRVMDDQIPAPFEAGITFGPGYLSINVVILDPDDDSPVGQSTFQFQPRMLPGDAQPDDNEIAHVAAELRKVCLAHRMPVAGNA